MQRDNALLVRFSAAGAGTTIVDTPPDTLGAPGTEHYYPTPAALSRNLRLADLLVGTRPGYKAFASAPNTNPINGLFFALYDSGVSELIRGTRTSLHRHAGGNFATSIAGAYAPGGADLDTWSFAMVRRAGAAPSTRLQLIGCNGVDAVWRYLPAGANVTLDVGAATFTGARALLGHGDRILAFNCIDSGAIRRAQRLYFSIAGVGEPPDFTTFGSGVEDLSDDAYPISACATVAGNVCVYKGNNAGGSIVVGTRTGSPTIPYRWDTINPAALSGVGILLPRTLLVIPPGIAFFVGHDGFYVHDGGRGIQQVAPGITKTLIPRVNQNALRAGIAWYRHNTREVVVGIPTGTSTFPDEYWVWSRDDNRVYGPWTFATSVLSAATFAKTTGLTWADFPIPWSSMVGSWGSLGGSASSQSLILGHTNGDASEDDYVQTTDRGSPISTEWKTPAFRAAGYRILQGENNEPRILGHDDVLTVREFYLDYVDGGAWTPTVQVSTTGGSTWTTISDATPVAGGGTGRTRTRIYTCEVPGQWFQFRILGGSGELFAGCAAELTYSGSARGE